MDPEARRRRRRSVEAAAAGVAALLALSGGTLGRASVVSRVDPATLRGEGAAVRLPSWAFGVAWARRGSTVALVVKPTGGTGFPIRVLSTPPLRVVRSVSVGARDVCGLTFRGPTLVALVSDRLCYRTGGSFAVVRLDVRRGRVVSTVAVPGLHVAYPTNVAFGDGRAYVAHAGGGVDVVNLATGAVAARFPRRVLAKGAGIVPAHWLGRHQLALGAKVVDVRTWRSRVLEPGAHGVVAAGSDLVAYGPRGVAVYTRGGRLVFRPVAAETVWNVEAFGRYVYAGSTVIDTRARRVSTGSPAAATLVLS